MGWGVMARSSGFRSVSARDEYATIYRDAIRQSSIPIAETDIATSYGNTHVLTAGEPAKPPLVVLHAKAFSSTMWIPLLPAFAGTHRVFLIDAVGDLNLSVASRVLSKPSHVAAWLNETLDGLAIERSAFAAASIGTWMATHLAMRHPMRVERLAMICPAGIVSRQHFLWLLSAIAAGTRPTRPRLERFVDSMAMPATRPRLRQDPWRPVVEQFVTGLPTFRARPNEARPTVCDIAPLAADEIPMLIIIGNSETLHDGKQMADKFRQKLPKAHVEVI